MKKAALYLRVSLDATGDHLAVDRQREDCLAIAAARGWEVVHEYMDNSISASKAEKVRPDYDRMCRDYELGLFDALVCWDLDRLTRQPRQLEDWIDRAEQRGLLLVTANGEADLTTDGGRMYARIKAAVARAEIERKSARQSRAQRQRAELGKPAKGIRPTGYTLTGELVPEEAELVKRVFSLFNAGASLFSIAKGLQAEGVPTRRGGKWSNTTVGNILRNPRYAGRSVYKGQDVGPANWPAIVTEAEYNAAQARLNDPRRKTNRHGTARKHLGSGVYFCECGLRVRMSSSTGSGGARYTCRDACYYRTGDPIDEFVLAVVRERLAQPDVRALLVRPADKDELDSLVAEMEQLRARMVQVEQDYDEGLIDGRRYRTAADKLTTRLEAVARKQAALASADSSASVFNAEDPVAAFDAAPLEVKQRAIKVLADITLARGQRGKRGFDPESVRIVWRGQK